MGDPKESYQDYIDGSPIKYAKNLKPLLNALDTDLLKPEDIVYINK